MAAPTLTYTLTNGSTADATQVMQNFNDLLNGITDGTKDLSISALTCAGTATLNGHVNLGNSSSDDLTVTASLASTLAIKTTNTYDIGSSTKGLAGVYFGTGDTDTARIVSASLAASRTYTLPDAGGAADFVMTAGAQTVAGAKTFTSATMVDGSADAVQLTVQGNGTQTNNIFVVENSAGTDVLAVGASAITASKQMTLNYATGGPGYTQVNSDSGGADAFQMIIQCAGTNSSSSSGMLHLQYTADTNVTGAHFVRFSDSEGTIGKIEAAGDTTVAYTTSSDERLKTDIEDFTDSALDVLGRCRVRKYKWARNGVEDVGFIAQELQNVYPRVVHGDPTDDVRDSPMAVEYGRLTPLLTAGVQELLQRVEALEATLG